MFNYKRVVLVAITHKTFSLNFAVFRSLFLIEMYAKTTRRLITLVWFPDTKTLSVCDSWFAPETLFSCGRVRVQFLHVYFNGLRKTEKIQ